MKLTRKDEERPRVDSKRVPILRGLSFGQRMGTGDTSNGVVIRR